MTQQPLDYAPPAAAAIKARQDDPDALRYLIAQRRIHSKAKFWQGVSWIGLLLIGLAAPVVSVIWSDLALLMGRNRRHLDLHGANSAAMACFRAHHSGSGNPGDVRLPRVRHANHGHPIDVAVD
jgi:hypothetical protein